MRSIYRQIASIVSLMEKRERMFLFFLGLGAMGLGIIETLGVSTIMPFIAVASQPELIETNSYLAWAYSFFGFSSHRSFLFALGMLMFAFIVLRNAYSVLYAYMQNRFTSMRRHTLSLKLLRIYISQKYPFFLNKNSYDFVKNINGEIERMITGTLMQMVIILSYIFQIVLLTAFLFYINPFATFFITALLVFVYGFIYFIVKKEVGRLGAERFELSRIQSQVVNEAFWGIKETKISGCEHSFVSSYVPPSKRLARNVTKEEIIGIVPKYVLEVVSFSSILFFIMIMISNTDDFKTIISSISVYAYAGYRLMPADQNLFRAFSKFKYSMPAATRIVSEFAFSSLERDDIDAASQRMEFSREIALRDIAFSYGRVEEPAAASSAKRVIDGISLTIRANTLVGFAGKTGSGKTTLVDIILGLLIPQGGTIEIDGTRISSANIRNWQRNLGYVPQNIYLSNDTIASNIAFGVAREDIDMDAVRNAASLAQIDEFISRELPDAYETVIGERGIRLSGGQRQRIGIARALYRDPSVLVMDEATSALDNQTELDVMQAIDGLSGKKTIILIAHRLTTLRRCDEIFLIERGTVQKRGTYDELFPED